MTAPIACMLKEHLDLLAETLHLAVALVDLYFYRQRISLDQVQLLGVCCLIIASKYEERFPPQVRRTRCTVIRILVVGLFTVYYNIYIIVGVLFIVYYLHCLLLRISCIFIIIIYFGLFTTKCLPCIICVNITR